MDENFDAQNDFRKIRKLRALLDFTDEEFAAKSEQEKLVLLKLRRAERKLTYRYDFWKFILEVLDAERKGERPVKLGKLHWRLCRHIRRCKNLGKNCLVRVPRYHLKTHIATTYYRIWRLVNVPELCGLIVSGTLELSKDTSRSIKQELSNNQKLKVFYPEVLPDWIKNERKNKWAETEFNVARSGQSGAQCTIEAVGVNATVTGKHFAEISFDDVVTKENSQNPEQCQKVVNSYRYFISIVSPQRNKGKIPIMVVGTNYNDHDLYSYLDEPGVRDFFLAFVEPIPPTMEPIWPEFYTKEMLEEIRTQQGTYVFATQYHLDPVPEDQQEIRSSWIQVYADIPRDVNGQAMQMERRIIVDPITAKPTDSSSYDRGVVLSFAWDKRKNIYLLDYLLYTRAKESEMFAGIFQQSDKWDIKKILWESVAYQGQGKYNLEEKSAEHGKALRVEEFSLGHRDKDFRIRTLIPHFERGQIFIKHWMHDLIQEAVRFPHGKTRDILDILASALRYVCAGRAKGMWRAEQSTANKAWYL